MLLEALQNAFPTPVLSTRSIVNLNSFSIDDSPALCTQRDLEPSDALKHVHYFPRFRIFGRQETKTTGHFNDVSLHASTWVYGRMGWPAQTLRRSAYQPDARLWIDATAHSCRTKGDESLVVAS